MAYRAMPVPLALLLSRLAAAVFGFGAHKSFSFRRTGRPSSLEVVGYATLAILNFAIVATALSVFASEGELFVSALKLALEMALFVVNFFLLRRLFLGSQK